MDESKSKFILLNNTDIRKLDEEGNPITGEVVYVPDYKKGKKTLLRYIDGLLNGDLIGKNGKIIMQRPAVESEGHQEYWRSNKLHRDNGEPAVYTDGFTTKEWWYEGQRQK